MIFENEFFQLLEYTPLTAKVHERPILFVPPCINKFYILDLQPENSLIRHTVAEGHRVFVMSWKNAGEEIAQRTWDDYIDSAVLRAIAIVREISGQEQINTLGFCIGGTILATALAVESARGRAPAASMTLLTTFLDFSETGILDIFIDEGSVRMREMTIGAQSAGGGSLLKGQELATTFSFLRPNELVWNYVVANYLKGEAPPPFDLLYWNSDGTNLPGPMYCWYLRNTYLENNLVQPGKVDGLRREDRPRQHRRAELPLRLARGPHRAVARGLPQHAGAQGQAPLRSRRVGPHRRRDQPAAEEEAQPLDRQERGVAGFARGMAGRCGRAPGQLVDRLVGLARAVRRQAGRRAEEARPGQVQGDRARARSLRQGKGGMTPHGLRVAPAGHRFIDRRLP